MNKFLNRNVKPVRKKDTSREQRRNEKHLDILDECSERTFEFLGCICLIHPDKFRSINYLFGREVESERCEMINSFLSVAV